MTPRSIAALTPYLVLSGVHLVAQAVDTQPLSGLTQALLMPALALYLVWRRPPRTRLTTLTLVALGCSWLGDSLPRLLEAEPAFLAMVGCFLLAQLAYIIAFRPYRYESVLHRHRRRMVPYGIVVVALVVVCVPGAGLLAPAVVIYGGCLLAMAVLATGIDRLAAVGGALFLLSDGLIALEAFADWWALPRHDVAVMTTYLAAQLLLVLGVLRRDTADRLALEHTPGVRLEP